MLEHAIEIANRNISKETQKNPVKAIRAKCIDCNGAEDYNHRIKECELKDCPLYPFRMGTNPFRTRKELTPEQKQAITERLSKAREKRKLNMDK